MRGQAGKRTPGTKQAPVPTPSRLRRTEDGAGSPTLSSWHLQGGSCTWVVGPQGGGGATLPPVPGATHSLLTAKGPWGLSPAPPPALCQTFQTSQSLALAWVPAAVAPQPTGIGRTCCAYRLGSEVTGHPLHTWRCALKLSLPHLTLLEGQVASPPHRHRFSGSLVSTYCVQAQERLKEPR